VVGLTAMAVPGEERFLDWRQEIVDKICRPKRPAASSGS
jgi:hypothetical protein